MKKSIIETENYSSKKYYYNFSTWNELFIPVVLKKLSPSACSKKKFVGLQYLNVLQLVNAYL